MLKRQNEMRTAVLQLYRDCLRSARRIPTQEQREIWLQYTRGKFKENWRVADVRLKRAFEDGQEQLARMNYFHEVREKQQQQHQHQTTLPNGRQAHQHNNNHHHHHHAPTTTSNGTSSSPSQKHSSSAAPTPTTASSSLWCLSTFLHTHLSGIEEEDLIRYEKELQKDGFDSLAMLKYLEKDDIGSWKKAHRRAMLAAVASLKKKEEEG